MGALGADSAVVSGEASKIAIHLLGAGLVITRLCHAVGLQANTTQGLGRALGAGGTALIVLILAVWLIVKCAMRLVMIG